MYKVESNVFVKTTKEGFFEFCSNWFIDIANISEEDFRDIFDFESMTIKYYETKEHDTTVVFSFTNFVWGYHENNSTNQLLKSLTYISSQGHPYHLIRYTTDFVNIDDFHSEGAFSVIEPLEFGVWNNEPEKHKTKEGVTV